MSARPDIRTSADTGIGFMAEDFRFLLNMQLIADGMEAAIPGTVFSPGNDCQNIERMRCFRSGGGFPGDCVVIARAEDLEGETVPEGHIFLITAGNPSGIWNNGVNSVISVPEETDLQDLVNVCQDIFSESRSYAEDLRNIVMQDGSVDDLCEAAYGYFHNPLFVHDPRLNIISCPVWRSEMIPFKKDARSGLLITPQDEMNELKTDREYQETLHTRGAHYYSADLRGYRDIYVNIWNEYGTYEGRLVICELETAFKPGQMAWAVYLEKMIRLVLSRRKSTDKTGRRALDSMLLGMIQGGSFEESDIVDLVGQIGWKVDDEYICICMDAEEREGIIGSAASICNQVEGRIDASKAVAMDTGLCIVINRSLNHDYTSELAYILRDGLFKAGFCTPFHNLAKLERYYRQAAIALEYCKKKNDMMWYYSFNDIALEYLTDECCRVLAPEELCASALLKLKSYDEENHTELYRTLTTYVLNERNTVATSSALFIGRSTLFYRLRKIKEVTGLDAARISAPEQNLYLRLSIYIMENKK